MRNVRTKHDPGSNSALFAPGRLTNSVKLRASPKQAPVIRPSGKGLAPSWQKLNHELLLADLLAGKIASELRSKSTEQLFVGVPD